MEANYKKIGKNIKAIRNAKGMTQAELAERSDLSAVSIGYIENAKKQASLSALISIANALEVGMDNLLVGQEKHVDLFADTTERQRKIVCDIIKAVKDILEQNNI